jgi:hypothetical protein
MGKGIIICSHVEGYNIVLDQTLSLELKHEVGLLFVNIRSHRVWSHSNEAREWTLPWFTSCSDSNKVHFDLGLSRLLIVDP